MAKTKDKVSDAAGTVKPYVERALRDEELRENVRNAYDSARSIYNELLGNRGVTGVAARVATDKDIQAELRSAIAELRHAADRVQGKQEHSGRNGGLLLNHCITRPDNKTGPSAGGFIDRYVFPDGELTGSGRIITEAQDIGLEVIHEENLRHHYALTLRDWCRNLVENWDEAVEEVGLPTAKVWGLYMAGSRLGFETNVVQLHQVLAVKLDSHGRDGGLPLRPWWTP